MRGKLALILLSLVIVSCLGDWTKGKPDPFVPTPNTEDPLSVQRLIQQGEADRAMDLLEAQLKDIETGNDLYWYGVALRMRGRIQEAEEILQRALLRDPKLEFLVEKQLVSLWIESEKYRQAGNLLLKHATQKQDRALAEFLLQFQGAPHQIYSKAAESMLLNPSSLPELPVRLEGHANASFVVDTGASFSVISVSLAKRIGLFQRVEGGVLIDLEGKPIQASYSWIGRVQIGKIEVRNVPVLIVEDQALRFRLFGVHSVFGAEGVLGMSLLRHFRLVFDFPKRRVYFLERTQGEQQEIPLLSTGLNLYLPVQCADSRPMMFRIDTGSNQSSLNPRAVEAARWENRLQSNISYIAGAEGWSASLKQVSGAQLQIGSYRLRNLNLPVLPGLREDVLDFGGVIGVDLLQHFQLTLDPYLMTASLEQ